MKKRSATIFATTMLILVFMLTFIGCQANTPAAPADQEQAITTVSGAPVQTAPSSTTEAPSLGDRFADVKVDVLAKHTAPYSESEINGYGAYSEDYETATILTLGLTFPDQDTAYNFGGATLVGESATGEDGQPVPQACSLWRNDEKLYCVVLLRAAGEIDAEKACVKISEKYKGTSQTASAVVSMQNGAEPIGFDGAKEAFPKEIQKLQGRTYMVARRYWSNYSAGTDYQTDTISYVLIPLEGGLEKTLDAGHMKLFTPSDIKGTSGVLLVNENGVIDSSTLKSQNTIELAVTRSLYEERGANGYSDEVYERAAQDTKDFVKASYVEIDDGDGNTVVLRFGD